MFISTKSGEDVMKLKNNLFIITRGQYGCSVGRYCCVIKNLYTFKIMMRNSRYSFDSINNRFHNDSTRYWYKATSIEILEDDNIINSFHQEYPDLTEAEKIEKINRNNYKKTGRKAVRFDKIQHKLIEKL